jgi:hypothetical protein
LIEARSIFGTLGCALLVLPILLALLQVRRFSKPRVRAAVALGIAVALLVPLGSFAAAEYVRSVTGDVSASTLALAWSACAARVTGRNPIDWREQRALCGLLGVAAASLYPCALGLTPFDPYGLGYGSPTFLTVLALIALSAWRARLQVVALVVVVAVCAFSLGVYDSRNLWDYLIDPLGCGFALVHLARSAFRRSLSPVPTA